jgi:putative membrane protein
VGRVKKLLIHFAIIAASLWLVDYLFEGVRFTSIAALAVGALVLGFVNAIVRPILTLLTLPVTIVSLGLFYFVVNGLAFGLAAFVVPGFQVHGLLTAVLAALITSIVSTVLEAIFADDD